MHHPWKEGNASGISEGSTFVKPHKRKGASAGSSGARVKASKARIDSAHSYPARPYPAEYQEQVGKKVAKKKAK